MELKINNLNKTYPNGVVALKNVSLHISSGMFGLLGANGAGKSTLMRTIATLQEADSGTITLNGTDVLKEKDKVRKLLGYLPQEFGLYPRVSAETLLNHLTQLKGISNPKERKETVKALLQKTNLYEHRHKNLGGYSGGMKQRFGIAQALIGEPKLIIVDEHGCELIFEEIELEDNYVDCLQIPNAFSPNGDGYNDTWEIGNIGLFPRAFIQVYTRWGQLIYEGLASEGFWDATYNFSPVPTGSYLYIINLGTGADTYNGVVTVVR